MALFTIPDVALCGVASAVPANQEDNLHLEILTEKEREMLVKTVGIRYRRVAPAGITASDLCEAAARKLLEEMQWNPTEVQVLVFVTQTPDYIIPNTSSLLQHKLGLSKNCIAFDVNLGCSGYVYGLSIVGSLLSRMPQAKALLLVGDVSTATISHLDRSTWPLFSDAGSATAITYKKGEAWQFNLNTDGSEFDDIIVPDGGFRTPVSPASLEMETFVDGSRRTRLDMRLDGLKIFNFSLREVAPNIQQLLQHYNITTDDVDYFLFHQANKLMNESVRRKLSLPEEKVHYSLYDFGNTSSASIPVTLSTKLGGVLSSGHHKLVMSGFGVGLSWGSVFLPTSNLVMSALIEL